jgi:hypothetical protein
MPDLTEFVLLFLILGTYLVLAIPCYTLGRRRGISAPALAFVPVVGPWLVVFRSIGWKGWWLGLLVAALVVLPYVGLAATAWAGIQVPLHHRRSRWWSVLLAIPLVNLVGYWIYAFTLPKPLRLVLAAPT